MEELSEISEIDTQNCSQELESVELKPPITYTCWICIGKKGANTSKFICPCKCLNRTRFVHVECLERFVNNKETKIFKNKFCCPYCQVRYPLEIKRKSLLAYYRETLHRTNYVSVFNSIFNVFLSIGLIIILYKTMPYFWNLPVWRPHHIISLIGLCLGFFFGIVSIIIYIILGSKSIYNCYKGYESFEEFKLIEQNVSIQVTEL